ncbi:protein phyllopod [Uranotaenia lowii]|uniref:protein phyllopod n=1 Tax=Uranotaenia lowii TaxID=190385 RepID=UPI00247B1D16|nr:protein phyllopod [Uranotaenia lowii]
MSASTSNNDTTTTGSGNQCGEGSGGGLPSGGAPHGSKKTNVCLICGIYTNQSLNIFEPRNGPNIREVIYQKYNFKAERSDNEDKYICYSCNNWLINWYSLQHVSETRNYESTPSSSRSQSESRNKRTKNDRSQSNSSAGSSRNKENVEQDNHVSSTVRTPEKENVSPKRKPKRCSSARILRETCQQNVISSSTSSNNVEHQYDLVKPFESRLIRMLENQGTSVIKEQINVNGESTLRSINKPKNASPKGPHRKPFAECNEIVLSFDSAISELVEVIPSLKSLHQDTVEPNFDHKSLDTNLLSRSLSISIIEAVDHRLDLKANPTKRGSDY